MHNVTQAALGSNLDLFTWAEARHRRPEPAPTYPARVVARRYHLPLHRARLFAEFAGFKTEAL